MFVFGGQARAVVGAATHAEHDALQRRLFHLHHHRRRRARVAGGRVQVHVGKHRAVVAGVDDALLRVLQPREAVVGARPQAREPHQPLHGDGVVTFGAVQPHLAHLHRRTGVQLDVPEGLVRGVVDVAQAVDDAPSRVTFGREFAQQVRLQTTPAGLREALTHRLLAAQAQRLALSGGRVGGGDVATEVGGGGGHPGGRPRRHAHEHFAQIGHRAAPCGCRGFARHRDLGGKIALCAQQVAQVLGRSDQQPVEFARIEIGQGAKTLQLHVAQQEGLQLRRRGLDADAETLGRRCIALGLSRGARRGRRDIRHGGHGVLRGSDHRPERQKAKEPCAHHTAPEAKVHSGLFREHSHCLFQPPQSQRVHALAHELLDDADALSILPHALRFRVDPGKFGERVCQPL